MPSDELLSDYDVLAPHYDLVYDVVQGNRTEEIGIVRSILDMHRPDAQSMLDIATGTGAILRDFRGEVAELAGIDNSPDMLEIARRKLLEAEFTEADMAEFELGKEFDVALCLFNAINHLQDFEKWKSLFERTAQHLTPGGVFIFDVLPLGYMQRLVALNRAVVWPIPGGSFAMAFAQTGPNQCTATFTTRTEGSNGVPVSASGSIHEAVYPVEAIKAAAGKHLEPVIDFDAKPGILETGVWEPATDESTRPVFVYRKP